MYPSAPPAGKALGSATSKGFSAATTMTPVHHGAIPGWLSGRRAFELRGGVRSITDWNMWMVYFLQQNVRNISANILRKLHEITMKSSEFVRIW